jgi:hypothetical protein
MKEMIEKKNAAHMEEQKKINNTLFTFYLQSNDFWREKRFFQTTQLFKVRTKSQNYEFQLKKKLKFHFISLKFMEKDLNLRS